VTTPLLHWGGRAATSSNLLVLVYINIFFLEVSQAFFN